jgi:osmotically-inducible protein OsmY
MFYPRHVRTLVVVVALSSALPACSTFLPCQTVDCAADAKISAEISNLLKVTALESDSISVETEHGVAYLYGWVDTAYERNEAADLARASDAKSVVNDLSVMN